MNCPKCKAEMEEGFVAGPKVVEWIEGALDKGILLGVKVPDRKHMAIRTFRCVKCGFLESYAS